MRVIEPHQLGKFKSKTKGSRPLRMISLAGGAIIVLWLVLIWSYYYRPLPLITPAVITKSVNVEAKPIAWPSYGQAAVAAAGYGVMATNNSDTPRPIASIAKVITALAVLDKRPLQPGQPGPTITLTNQDVALYQNYQANGGSVVPVVEGEQLSQYQALQALLLPSANNVADSLVRWAFGSDQSYKEFANSYVKSLGMTKTTVAGASGFSSETVSTAHDLTILGQKALENLVMREIVAQPVADLPVAGRVENVNWLLGKNGVNGIKTGNTEEAGGCYLVSSTRQLAAGQNVTVVAAVLGAPSLGQAITDGSSLVDSTFNGFVNKKVINAGETVGYYAPPWGNRVAVEAKNDVNVLAWQGQRLKTAVTLDNLKVPAQTSQNVGIVGVTNAGKTTKAPVSLRSSVTAPTSKWRLSHIWL